MTTLSMNMPFFTLDTLQFSKRMQHAGLQQKVADELADALKESQSQSAEGLATKHDILLLDGKINLLEQKIGVLDQKIGVLDQKIDAVEHKIILKMFLMLVAAVGAITWLDKVIN